MFSARKTMQLLRIERSYKFYSLEISVLTNGRRICELCGRRNYSADNSHNANDLEFLRTLKEENHEPRYKRYTTKLKSITEDDLLERFRNLQKCYVVNYDSAESLPLLAKHPFTIRNRVELLWEAGFQPDKITASILQKYLTVVNRPIYELKKQMLIPQNVDVMTHILKFVDLEPQFYPEEMLDRSATLLIIRKSILRAFLKRKFDLNYQDLKDGGQNITRLWNKSFTTINRNIRLIEDEVGMPVETLRRNVYLLALNPANTETILREVKMVGDMDIHTALNARPKIMCNTCGNLNKILKLLEKYGIPPNFNHGLLKLFTLSYETVKRRLEELDDVEYFSINKSHPRILNIVMAQPKAKRRLKILEDVNLFPGSLNTLVTPKRNFERFLRAGFRQNSTKDTMFFLNNHYGISFPELRKKLDKHPYWGTVSLIEIGRNAKFLSKYIPREELIDCLLVLFYPSQRIQEEFFKLQSREGIDCCKENGRIKTKFIAPLLTYFLEKEANFSMLGIWSGEADGSEATDAPHVYRESQTQP
uniref:ATP synthase subunit beta n=1 Tax=Lygus hesperus TaxID=30085 RepID=A0A0A9WVV1_LYGHE